MRKTSGIVTPLLKDSGHLAYTPRIASEEEALELVRWLREQKSVDMVTHAQAELEARGLLT